MSNLVNSENKKLVFVVDVGTTTIKTMLCTEDGRLLGESQEKNSQSVFGTDVVSRILNAHYKGVFHLQKTVLLQILSLLMQQMQEGYSMTDVSRIIITGNTVMLHLARGLSVQGFEMAPFTPVTLEAAEIPFCELFTDEILSSAGELEERRSRQLPAPDTPVCFPPCIDAFVGADAVCAALSVLEREIPFPLLLADVGTNTEILLISSSKTPGLKKDANSFENLRISCCSTAAGPAFEGGVLGGRYTGSELVHLLAQLLKTGAMDETGLLDEEKAAAFSDPDMPVITQDAIRQLQLAKGAVCAAIDALLCEENLSVNDIGSFVLCGNFGSALDADDAELIGLFPAGLASVTEYAGNAAELGACLLMKEQMLERAKKIAASGKLFQLADSSYFARRYIERMNFTN